METLGILRYAQDDGSIIPIPFYFSCEQELCGLIQPLVPCSQCAIALQFVALFFIAHLLAKLGFEGRQQIEGDVGGLELPGLGVGDVVGEAAVGTAPGCGYGLPALGYRRSVAACQHA